MLHFHQRISLFILSLVLLTCIGCDKPLTSLALRPTATPAPLAVPQPNVTVELTNRSVDGSLSIMVLRAIENPPNQAAPPDDGQKWLVLEINIINRSNEPISIPPDALTLVDETDTHFPAIQSSDLSSSDLVGTTVEAGTSVLGLARFEVPEETTLPELQLKWCLDTTCDTALRVPIALGLSD